MLKNVASQIIELFAFDVSTGLPKTGDAANITAYVAKDGGTVTVLADTSAAEMDATNAPGWYKFDVAQAETNADRLLFTGKSSTSNIRVVGRPVLTRPPNFTTLAIDSTGAVKVQAYLKKNTAVAGFPFTITDSTAHNPYPGQSATLVLTRQINGAAPAGGTLSNIVDRGNGRYTVDFAAADLNGDTIVLNIGGSGIDQQDLLIVTVP